MYNRKNDEIRMNCGIKLADVDKEYFFNIKLFSNTAYIEILKTFLKMSVEINYPSKSFEMILNKIIGIKSELINDIDTCIFILDSVTSIKNNAFLNRKSLTQITISSSITSIGYHFFMNAHH